MDFADICTLRTLRVKWRTRFQSLSFALLSMVTPHNNGCGDDMSASGSHINLIDAPLVTSFVTFHR